MSIVILYVIQLQYSEPVPSKLATVDLVWGNNFLLDKPANMNGSQFSKYFTMLTSLQHIKIRD